MLGIYKGINSFPGSSGPLDGFRRHPHEWDKPRREGQRVNSPTTWHRPTAISQRSLLAEKILRARPRLWTPPRRRWPGPCGWVSPAFASCACFVVLFLFRGERGVPPFFCFFCVFPFFILFFSGEGWGAFVVRLFLSLSLSLSLFEEGARVFVRCFLFFFCSFFLVGVQRKTKRKPTQLWRHWLTNLLAAIESHATLGGFKKDNEGNPDMGPPPVRDGPSLRPCEGGSQRHGRVLQLRSDASRVGNLHRKSPGIFQ